MKPVLATQKEQNNISNKIDVIELLLRYLTSNN